jgi:hypothetical protein
MQDSKKVMLLKEGGEEGQKTKVKGGAFENPCNTPVTRLAFNHLRLTTASNQTIKLLGIA